MNMFHKGWMTQFLQKYLPWITLGLFAALLLTVPISCGLFDATPEETRAPQEFPDTDIVFTTSRGVGFVNADGTELFRFEFSMPLPGAGAGSENAEIARAVMNGENNVLIAKLDTAFSHMYMTNPNILVIWPAGEMPIYCLQWGGQQGPLLSTDREHLFIDFEKGLRLYDLDSCGTEAAPSDVYPDMSGIPSPDMRFTAEPVDAGPPHNRNIVIHDLENGTERIVEMGDYPAWSPDSAWLAFTGLDGIYIVNVLGDEQTARVIEYRNPVGDIYPTYHGINQIPPPEPSWSPDGKWLSYHRLTVEDNGSDFPAYHSIFVVNIETHQEVLIAKGGMYPSWRWPAEGE
jgi:hypothetical protein